MRFYLALLFLLIPALSAAGIIVGGESAYIVREGDSLSIISSRLGVSVNSIVSKNHIDPNKFIHKGQKLLVNTIKIVPMTTDNGIIINIPERMLYFFRNGKLDFYFPVGLGMAPQRGRRDWGTPLGRFSVQRKDRDPTWYVPVSIQQEMEAQGKPVKTIVPPGPDNPLGSLSVRLSIPGILIHETIAPTSVYQFRSHGCIRVMPEHIEQLFEKVEINTSGELIYKPVKAAVSDQGRILLEVHRDIYGKTKDLKNEALMVIEKLGVVEKVNWEKVEAVLRDKSGVVEDITL